MTVHSHDLITLPETVRVGSRRRVPGPLGTDEWHAVTIGDRRQFYQEVQWTLIYDATIEVHGSISIACRMATHEELDTLDRTLALVPPEHLQLLLRRRPGGILVSETAGRGDSMSYLGGVNPSADDTSTPLWNERELIVITHGAFWQFGHLPICPTVLHEIGHRMTDGGEINHTHFPAERRERLRGLRVSRNPGEEEALCNAYAALLCYGSADAAVRAFGTGSGITNDRVARDGLRACPAFRAPMLDAAWTERLAERPRS
jgi:hypothetical protein